MIVLDILLIILLIILIVLARRGSKKLKAAAMAKKHRKSETTVATEVTKITSHKKMKEKHRSIIKKSATETGTTIGGYSCGDDDETEHFTIKGKLTGGAKISKDSYFDKSSKKKNKKKKGKK